MNEIPWAPGKVPVLGHAVALLRDPQAFLSSLPASGDMVRIKLGPIRAIMLCDLELTRQVLREDRTFDRTGPLFDRVQEAVGSGITQSSAYHKQTRRLIQPAFARTRLPGYAQKMNRQLTEVTDSWRDGQTLDILAEMQAVTTKSALAAMFSHALAPAALEQATDDLGTIFAGFYRRAVTPSWLSRVPGPGNARYWRAIGRLRKMVAAIVAERRASAVDHDDLLSSLLAAEDTEEAQAGAAPVTARLSDAEIGDAVMGFFIAGVQSTATLLTWALHLVATHPDIEARLVAETTSVAGSDQVSFEHVSELRLTAQVVTETLRLYPPGWLLVRTANVDTRLSGHDIPAGTVLFFSPYLIHHRDDLYPDAGGFDPGRWDRVPPPPSQPFIAFGYGPGKCVAENFGFVEATLALASIISRWHLEPVPGERVRPALAFALRPQQLHLRAAARDLSGEASSLLVDSGGGR
jgi:cytochrome P450